MNLGQGTAICVYKTHLNRSNPPLVIAVFCVVRESRSGGGSVNENFQQQACTRAEMRNSALAKEEAAAILLYEQCIALNVIHAESSSFHFFHSLPDERIASTSFGKMIPQLNFFYHLFPSHIASLDPFDVDDHQSDLNGYYCPKND